MNLLNPYLRPWKVSDAKFVLSLRNNPDYMKYYRQDKPISLKEEIEFIKKSKENNYNAYILMDGNKRLGIFGLHGSELCIVAPLKYHEIGLQILKAMNPNTMIFGDIFTYNPALKIYLNNGFEVYEVKEKYCKKNGSWVSAVIITSV